MKHLAIKIEEWEALAKEGLCVPIEITLSGTSMQPLIRKDRDVITIVPKREPLAAGDLVLFRRADGNDVVHRIYRLSEDVVVTLGDHCETPDPPMHPDRILGTVIKISRGRRVIIPGEAAERRYRRFWMWIYPIRKKWMHVMAVLRTYQKRGRA